MNKKGLCVVIKPCQAIKRRDCSLQFVAQIRLTNDVIYDIIYYVVDPPMRVYAAQNQCNTDKYNAVRQEFVREAESIH